MSFFFIFFIFVCSYFLVNLFIGVIFLNYIQEYERQMKVKGLSQPLTDEQLKWIEMQRMIVTIKPDLTISKPQSKFRKFFHNIVLWGPAKSEGLYFDLSIMLVIVANIVTMALAYEGSTITYRNVLKVINYVFTGIFIFEFIAKNIGLGLKVYWINSWNKFDAFVVFASILDILMDAVGNNVFSFLRVGPQLARVIRVLRVTRLLKLIKSFQGIQQILQTLTFALPSLMNVLALLFLVFFIYAVLSVSLFSKVVLGTVVNEYNNFSNFGNAMIILFRCSTGEDWFVVMFDTMYPKLCADGTIDCGICNPFLLALAHHPLSIRSTLLAFFRAHSAVHHAECLHPGHPTRV